MTDLLHVAPSLATQPFSNILPSLERHRITAVDLLTLDAIVLARRAQVPARDVRRLTQALQDHFRARWLSTTASLADAANTTTTTPTTHPPAARTGAQLCADWQTISLLDDRLDAALGGGIPTGYLCEVTGESGVGKTQLLLTLLLSVQLPATQGGLDRGAIYISTEAPLQTVRLQQLLDAHPRLTATSTPPTLSRILSIQTPDLESQDHILRYQLPVAIRRHGIGLVIIDSVTANFRAEFDADPTARASTGAAMARRSAQLIELGALLRRIAHEHAVAIVVANQVADRFDPPEPVRAPPSRPSLSQPAPRSELNPPTLTTFQSAGQALNPASAPATPAPSRFALPRPVLPQTPPAVHPRPTPTPMTQSTYSREEHGKMQAPLLFAHQQRFFTGWGDSLDQTTGLKTPSLGLIWTNQIAARIALIRERAGGTGRRFKVVFAAWAPDSADVEFGGDGQSDEHVGDDEKGDGQTTSTKTMARKGFGQGVRFVVGASGIQTAEEILD